MCGIWAHLCAIEDETTARLGTDAAALRGPDGSNTIAINTNAGILYLGHRRLAIYDTSDNGAQPMTRGPLTIVFNGALYNFKEKRQELEALGEKFYTQTDTETLLAAWESNGISCLRDFDGMFAFALYDKRDNSLWLCRDRFGEKPLHILKSNRKIAIASEIGQFQAAGLLKEAFLNHQVAKDFIDLGIAEQGEETFFKGIDRLGAGKYLRLDLGQSGDISQATGDIFPNRPSKASAIGREEATHRLRAVLEKSIERRLNADVKVGSCLSGGLDSSAIVAIASKLLPKDAMLECFCAVFDETDSLGNDISEREYAIAAAKSKNLNLNFVTFDEKDSLNYLDTIIKRQAEPFAHSSIIAQYKVFEAAKAKGVKVMLDGQGADELFGGYSGTIGHRLADCLFNEGPQKWRSEISAFAADGAELDIPALKRATFNAIFPEKFRRNLARLRGKWPQKYQVTNSEISILAKKYPSIGHFESLLRNLQDRTSLPSLLRYEDRNAMSFGIESRLPFLGLEIAKLADEMPSQFKSEFGWSKAILRNAVFDILPEKVRERRRKLGFITPHDRWIAGQLKNWTLNGIDMAYARFPSLFMKEKIHMIKAQIGANIAANSVGFRIACLGHWSEIFDVKW